MTASRVVRAAFAAVALATSIAAQPAHAQSVGTSFANGTYSPGLPTTGCVSDPTTTRNGTMVLAGAATGTYSFTFTGRASGCASLTSSSGSGTMSGGVSGSLTFVRTGANVTYNGVVTVGGRHLVYTSHCVEAWGSVGPVTAILAETCVVVIV